MKLFTSRQAAEQLGVNVNTLFRWINTGKIKARKAMLGSGWRFTDGDLKAIDAWRDAPLGVLDLVKLDDTPPERVDVESAKLRPDLELFGAPFKGCIPYGSEHPCFLLQPKDESGRYLYVNGSRMNDALRSPPWSILESPEYLNALAEHRAKPALVAKLSPEQEQAHRLFEQFEAEQENEK